MAITIKVEPQEIQSAYNEVIIVLDSTNKAQDKFKYVVDININGTFSSRLKIQSNPQGFGIVNLQKHLESYVTSSLDLESKDMFKKIEDSYTEYDITLSEEYVVPLTFATVTDNGGFCQYNFASDHYLVDGDFITISSSTVPAYDGVQEVTSTPSSTAIVTTEVFTATASGDGVISNNTTNIISDETVFTGDKFVLNNVLNWVDVPNWDATEYRIDSGGDGKMFTNLPTTMTTRLDDRFTIHFNNNHIANEARYLKVTSNNNGTFFFDNDFPVGGATTRFLSVGVGAFDITNGTLSGTATSGTLPVIDINTKSYTVELMDASFSTSSEVYTFEIDRRCQDFDMFRLMYLNKGGSFSTFNFELQSGKSVSAKKTTFKQGYGSYDSASNSYGWSSSDRNTVVIDTDIKETYSITSDYMNEAQGNLIEDLIISPIVYQLSDNQYSFTSSKTITNITSHVDGAEITTSTDHGLDLSSIVLFEGINLGYLNVEHQVIEILSSTSYVIDFNLHSVPFIGGGQTMKSRRFGSDGVLRAIDINTSSVKIKKRRVDSLINYSIDFKYSNKNTVQR